MPRRRHPIEHHCAARELLDGLPETLAGGDLEQAERIGRTVGRLPPPRGGSIARVRALEARVDHLQTCCETIIAALAPDAIEGRPLPGEPQD